MKSKATDDSAERRVDRRGVLKSLGRSAAGTAAVAAGAAAVVPGTAEAVESAADRVKKRYRDSDHVKTYYRVNRY